MQIYLPIYLKLLFLTFSNIILYVLAGRDNVVFVNIIARHGARTPTWFYGTDPHQNHPLFQGSELGSLLEEGRKQTYNLGLWLGRRYGHLFSDQTKIYVYTTDVQRVKDSAKCCLSGMFSAERSPVVHFLKTLAQLGTACTTMKAVECTTDVPINSHNSHEDHILGGRAPCSAYTKEYDRVHESEEMKTKNKEFLNVYRTITAHSGSVGKFGDRFDFIHKIYDIVIVEKELGLGPDKWADDMIEQMKDASIISFAIQTWTDKLKRLKIGPLLGQMIDDMNDKISKKTDLNGKLYYAHDLTIVNFLNTLGVYDMKDLPDYASCVLLELIKVDQGEYEVKLYYSQSTKPKAKLLIHKSLEDFISSTKHLIPSNWHEECNATS